MGDGWNRAELRRRYGTLTEWSGGGRLDVARELEAIRVLRGNAACYRRLEADGAPALAGQLWSEVAREAETEAAARACRLEDEGVDVAGELLEWAERNAAGGAK